MRTPTTPRWGDRETAVTAAYNSDLASVSVQEENKERAERHFGNIDGVSVF
jgi:hypothetical protein